MHMGSEGGYRGVLLFGLLASLLSSFFLFFSSILSVFFSLFSFLVERRKERRSCNDFARSLHEREGLVGLDDDDYDQRNKMMSVLSATFWTGGSFVDVICGIDSDYDYCSCNRDN